MIQPPAPPTPVVKKSSRGWVLALLGAAALVGAVVYTEFAASAPVAIGAADAGATATATPVTMGPAAAASFRPAAAQPATIIPPAQTQVSTATAWTPAVCSWAATYLIEDAQLDRQSAARGIDPRWPNQTPASKLMWASRWDQILALVNNSCHVSTGVPDGVTPAVCTDAMIWLADSAAGHDADLLRPGHTPSDDVWNRAWAAFYRTLSADIGAGCPHD